MKNRPYGPAIVSGYRGSPDINQPYFHDYATGPLINQHGNYGRYEVAANEAFFTYIRYFGKFDANAQKQPVANYLADGRRDNGFARPAAGRAGKGLRGGPLQDPDLPAAKCTTPEVAEIDDTMSEKSKPAKRRV